MALTNEQHKTLSKYLRAVGIKEQEPFEEFYDHIASGFEHSKIQDLGHYIDRVAQPGFGGTNGMLRIIKSQNKLRKAMIVKRAKEIFLGLFGWPTVLIVIASYLLVHFGLQQFGQKFMIIFSLAISLLIPLIIVGYGQLKFYLACKKNKLPYSSSNLNTWLLAFLHFPFSLVNLFGNAVVPMLIGRDAFKHFLTSYPLITVVLSTLVILFGYTYLMLIKEKFVFEIQTT